MDKHSAGILVHRRRERTVEVFLVHPGGPFWVREDAGAWSIPKGEFDADNEEPLDAAIREFKEETGFDCPAGYSFLGTLKQPSGKIIHAWTVPGELDPTNLQSNIFEMEWPRGSGQMQQYPEVDRAEWFDCITAKQKLHKGQTPLIDLLLERLGIDPKEYDATSASPTQGKLF